MGIFFGGSGHGTEPSCQVLAYYKFFPSFNVFCRISTGLVLLDDIPHAFVSTSGAAVDDISESDDDLSNTKAACKSRKTTFKKQQKRAGTINPIMLGL